MGKLLQDVNHLKEYDIERNSTIIINLRLRGGASRTIPPLGSNLVAKGPSLFKDAMQGKVASLVRQSPHLTIPSPYLVENTEKAPYLLIKFPEVSGIFNVLQARAIICWFNGFWPKYEELHQWIYLNWTKNCDIYLCMKGIFLVQFNNKKDIIINEGPWFWGRAGLFVTPWLLGFDATTLVVTKMLVWVRLQNLPLHFYHHQVLEGIRNSLGRFLKID